MVLPALFAVRSELRGELKPPRPYRDAADTPGEAADAEAAAEGQTFLIEYEAASGEVSLRAVTVQSVRVGAGGRRLGCYCHLRRAYREFVVDNILACGSVETGELVDPEPFLEDALGRVTGAGEMVVLDDGALREARLASRPQAVLLAALSRSDGYMHRSERICAEIFVERLVKPLGLSASEIASLHRRFGTLRPTPDQIAEALERLRLAGPEAVIALLRAAKDLVEADGRLHDAEINLINELSEDLCGVRMFD